jgi:hypothetical protein
MSRACTCGRVDGLLGPFFFAHGLPLGGLVGILVLNVGRWEV